MAVAYVQEWPIVDRSTDNYDFIADKIGTGPFDGLILHSAGFDEADGVFRIFDIWESKEQAQQFIEANLQPLVEQGPAGVSRIRERLLSRRGTSSTSFTT